MKAKREQTNKVLMVINLFASKSSVISNVIIL